MKTFLYLSVILNIVLLGVGGYFELRKWEFQEVHNEKIAAYSYKDNGQYIEQTGIYRAYQKKDVIVMLGDSHTYKAHWDELLGRGDIANRGIGSDETEGYLHRLNSVFDCSPKIVFIEGGANDIYYGITEDKILRNLAALIDTFQKQNIKVVVTNLIPVASFEPTAKSFNKTVISVNKKISDLAAAKNIDVIDLYSLVNIDGVLKPEFAQNDGTHLTAPAYTIWKNEIEKILKKYNL